MLNRDCYLILLLLLQFFIGTVLKPIFLDLRIEKLVCKPLVVFWQSLRIMIIIAALISFFTFLVIILFDGNYYLCVKSQWQINLVITCSFTCGVYVGQCFCYFIAIKCRASIAKNQESYTQNQKKLIADKEEVMYNLMLHKS